MSKPRLALTVSTLVLLVACNQVTSALSMGGEEKAADTAAATAAAPDPAAVVPGAPPVAAPPVALPSGPATVDDLLGLVHEGAASYVVFKAPDDLLGLAESAAATFEQPLTALLTTTAPDKLTELNHGFTLFKSGVADLKSALTAAGTDLERGIVVTSTSLSGDDSVVSFSASSPEAAKTLLTALKIPEADAAVCQPAPAHPGYVTCSKSQTALTAFKPGDAKVARGRLNAALPAVAIDDLAVLGYMTEGDVHFGLGQPAGGATLHVSAPPDAKDMFAALTTGPADLLRFAPAGTGFMWMKLDLDEAKRKGLNQVPAPFSATVGAFTGEVLFGGSADPAALQARFGFSDVTSLPPLADLAVALVGPMIHNKPIPDVPGSKVTFKAENLTFGTDKVKALHLGATGVPQAKALAGQVGLTLDGWLFPAEGTLAAVIGVDSKHVGLVKAAPDAEATLAALPAPLAASLRAGEVGLVVHLPLDSLQSPALLKLLDGALAQLPAYNPAAARSALAVAGPLSSTTMWITEHQKTGVIHFALQTIGHTEDDEGKAALAAALSADPVAAFTALATQYPDSPRLAAYQTRAGIGGPGALIGGSGPALLLAAGGFAAWFNAAQPGMDQAPDVAALPSVADPEPPVADEPAKADPPKADPPKADPPKADPPKADPPKTDPPKLEGTKVDPPKLEGTKVDPPQADPPKPGRVGRQDPK